MPVKQKKYKIVRMHKSIEHADVIIARRLTLKEAQDHCKNPETSSSTATSRSAKMYTEKYGDWFDGYEEDNQ